MEKRRCKFKGRCMEKREAAGLREGAWSRKRVHVKGKVNGEGRRRYR